MFCLDLNVFSLKIHKLLILLVSILLAIDFAIADELSEGEVAFQQQDYASAHEKWSQAAQTGEVEAEFLLGELYRLGNGVAKNASQARSHYIVAANRGHPLAQLTLGKLYYFEQLEPNQKVKALYWFNKAARQGNAEAQWMLGGMYFNGEGTKRNNAAAYAWLTIASENKHSQAQLNLDQIHHQLSAKELSDAETLAVAFKKNFVARRAIEEQQNKAFYWFLKSAQKNQPYAQFMVGEMLYKGEGVEKDSVVAYSWLTLAAEGGENKAVFLQTKLKKELTKKQLKQANNLITNYRQQYEIADNNDHKPAKVINKVTAGANKPSKGLILTLKSPKIEPITPMVAPESSSIEVKPSQTEKHQNSQLISQITDKQADAEESSITTETAVETIKTNSMSVAQQYRIQLGAFTTLQAAQKQFDSFAKKHPKLEAEYPLVITEPQPSSNKKTFFRLQLGAFKTKTDAKSLCQELKKQKQACFVAEIK